MRIAYPPELEDVVHCRLFLTRSKGNMANGDGALSAYFDSAGDRDAAADSMRDLPVTMRLEKSSAGFWNSSLRCRARIRLKTAVFSKSQRFLRRVDRRIV